MIKVKIEGDETPKMELEGTFTWGAVHADDGKQAFAIGRADPTRLVLEMAEACTDILLNVWRVERESPAANFVKRLFVTAIEKEFDDPDAEDRIVEKENSVRRCRDE